MNQNDHQEIDKDEDEEPLNEEETPNLYWEGENFEDFQYKEDGCPWLYTESWNYD